MGRQPHQRSFQEDVESRHRQMNEPNDSYYSEGPQQQYDNRQDQQQQGDDTIRGDEQDDLSYSGEESIEGLEKDDKYDFERSAINDAQSVSYTAYTMNLDSGQTIVNDLRNVGVTVLSLESLSTAAMIHYMDAVTTMRLGNENDEKCMLYTDRMGRVFNVIISVRHLD